MKILIDYDDTLFDNGIHKLYCKTNNIPMSKEYDFSDMNESDRLALLKLYRDVEHDIKYTTINKAAVDSVRRLYFAGCELYICTYRAANNIKLKKHTLEMIEHYFGDMIKDVIFLEHNTLLKIQYAYRVKADIIIDDSPTVLESFIKTKEYSCLSYPKYYFAISNDNTLHNHSAIVKYSKSYGARNMTAVNSIEDTVPIIEKIIKDNEAKNESVDR